jgi:hypothetical protein
MLENTEGVIKKDNPERLATYGTQDTGQINVREYRKSNGMDNPALRYSVTFYCPVSCVPYVASFSGLSFFIAPPVITKIWIIQRNWQYRVHKTQDK